MAQKIIVGIVLAITLTGLIFLALGYWILGGILTALGAISLFLFWRLYQILRISEAIGKEDFPRAKEYMAAIRNPEKLNDYSKTYYNFFKGIIDTRENNFKDAEQSFKRSIEINRFRAADEKATAHLMMGQLLLRKRNREGAKRHLQEAKALASNPQIKEQVQTLVKQARIRL